MATIKKAQYGDRITSRQKKRLGRISEKNPERAKDVAERMKLRATRRKRGSDLYDSLAPKEDLPAFKARTLEEAKKAKNGKSFPDLNKDGKITKADILKGRGVIKNGANIKKAQKGKKITPTADSTDFFEKRADRYDKAAGRLIRAGGYESVLRMKKVADQARDDAWRQGFKGKPGYDANGFPIPTKKKNAPKKKMQYGGAAASMKPTSKIKKAQAGSRLKDSDYETSPFVKMQMEMKQREKGSKPKESINLKSRQYKRLGRIEEKNPDRAYKVGERMELRKTREERGKGVAAGANFRQSYKQSEGEVKRPKANFTIPKIKKAQAGLTASNKRVGPVDPKGAWTKVQEMNLPPRNVKTKVSLTRDKQLGATKMMKMGGKAKAKKK